MKRSRLTPFLLPFGYVLLVGTLALAAPRGVTAGDKGESDFWTNLAQPGRSQYLSAMRKGRELFELGLRTRGLQQRTRNLQQALGHFQQAIGHSPKSADGFYWLGRTAYALDRMQLAVSAFTTVRRLQPSFGDQRGICFKLGIAFSKLGRFEEAVQEYSRADQLLLKDSSHVTDRSVMYANAAESLMALGRLDEAIQRYRDSLALRPDNVLAWWGLAVAYDRDEQVSKAREAIGRALALDSAMSRLTEDTVFFVPEGDIHYYFALGYQAKGDRPAARREWEAFVSKLPGSPWAFRSRQHLSELGEVSRPAKARRLAPIPQPAVEEPDRLEQQRNAVRRRLKGYLFRIRQCYQKELKRRPGLAGQLRLGITVGPDGRAQEVKVIGSTIKRPTLHACVVSTVRSITFHRIASGQPLRLNFPIEFKPIP